MMQLRLEQRLEAHDLDPEVCYDDFKNIKQRHPQTSRDGTVNYAFAGGSGVKLLLDADSGLDIKDPNVEDHRTHKDIEISVFQPSVFGKKNPNPHDVCGVNFFGPLKTIDYDKESPWGHGIYVELLNGSYFGFSPLPQLEDVRSVVVDGKRYLTLSPEFFIASQILNPAGIREGVDDVDAIRLMEKFSLDADYLEDLASRSDFSPILSEGDVTEIVKSNFPFSALQGFVGNVREKITQRYGESFDKSFARVLSYNALTSFLPYDPQDLKPAPSDMRDFKDLFEDTVESARLTLNASRVFYVALLHSMKHLDRFSRHRKGIAREMASRTTSSYSSALHLSRSIRSVLSQLAQLGDPNYGRISSQIATHLATTKCLHIRTGQYSKTINEALDSGGCDNENYVRMKDKMRVYFPAWRD